MKREDIAKLFEGATDEQVSALLDINSRDIGKAKGDTTGLQARVTTLEGQLATASTTIATLEVAKGDTVKLQAEINRHEQAEIERQAAESAAQLRAAVATRFDAIVGDRAFVHDFVRKGVLDAFEEALADKTNQGKGDAAIFDVLTRDKGYFASQNPPPQMGGMGKVDGTIDKAKFEKLSLYDQFEFANANPDQAKIFMEE